VLEVVSDRKLGQLLYTYSAVASGTHVYNAQSNEYNYVGTGGTHNQSGSTTEVNYDLYLPEVMSYSDYYPFHMQMPNRHSGSYRYLGANGQESETEITGDNSHSSAEYWMYDNRLGRRWNVDPVFKYNVSPYSTFANNPIYYMDYYGDEPGHWWGTDGNYLGTDGTEDDKAFVVEGTSTDYNSEQLQSLRDNPGDGEKFEELSISNTELLKRANWVYGESSGSGNEIDHIYIYTPKPEDLPHSSVLARVADYYAHAINNAVKADGSFDLTVKTRMSREVTTQEQKMQDGQPVLDADGKPIYVSVTKTINTSDTYFDGTDPGKSETHPSKVFAKARLKGPSALMNVTNAKNAISAVIGTVSVEFATSDPTYGCRAWLGKSANADPSAVLNEKLNGKKVTMGVYFINGKIPHGFYKY